MLKSNRMLYIMNEDTLLYYVIMTSAMHTRSQSKRKLSVAAAAAAAAAKEDIDDIAERMLVSWRKYVKNGLWK